MPADIADALAADEAASAWFQQLTDSQRKGFVTFVTAGKAVRDRQRRVARAVQALADHQKRP